MFLSLFPPVALQPFDEGQSRSSQVASFMPKRILGNSAIPRQGKTPACHFLVFFFFFFFFKCRAPSPTIKIQHRLTFLAFKTCPNCIGRSWNSCTERPETTSLVNRHVYSKADFRRPSLHETISHLCVLPKACLCPHSRLMMLACGLL